MTLTHLYVLATSTGDQADHRIELFSEPFKVLEGQAYTRSSSLRLLTFVQPDGSVCILESSVRHSQSQMLWDRRSAAQFVIEGIGSGSFY
jgi:hypothetical protein